MFGAPCLLCCREEGCSHRSPGMPLSPLYHSMLPLKAGVFLLLNAVRLLSIVALLLVFSAVVLLMAQDARAYHAVVQAGKLQDYTEEFCYFPDSDVPTTTWGLFWLQLDRFLLLCVALLGVASGASVAGDEMCGRCVLTLLAQ